MSRTINTSFLVGIIIVIVGCFLPWKQEGDFISIWTYGIQLFPSFKDNGGLLIVLLATLLFFLKFKSPGAIKNPYYWIIILSSVVLFASFIQIPLLLHFTLEKSGYDSPTLQSGLFMVCIGSILILISSIFDRVGSRLIPPWQD